MKKTTLFSVVLAAVSLPSIMWAIPQQIGGINNIMQEEEWERPPNYEEWRLDGAGRDGRLPAAGDPKPEVWVNTKPVDVFGIPGPEGSARLYADGGKWGSVDVRLPSRKSDDFHLLQRTIEAETGKKLAIAVEKIGRAFSAVVDGFNVDVRELATGELAVSISRAPVAKVGAR